MNRILVRYRVKADRIEEHLGLLDKIFQELEHRHPAGLEYSAFRLADGRSFAHLAEIDTPDGRNPLNEVRAFGEFTSSIKDRCDEPPVAVELSLVGAYRPAVD